MIASVQDFQEATVLERRMLEWSAALSPKSSAPSRLDLREDIPDQSTGLVGQSIGGSDPQETHKKFRPLLFGTAWKVLDLMLELALHHLAKPDHQQWSIKDKRCHANKFDGQLPGLTDCQDIWQRICKTYVATVEARHALVHRRLECDSAGAFVNLSSAPCIVTAAEQGAIQGLALYASGVALRQTCRERDKLVLGRYLNMLSNLHNLPKLAFATEQQPDLVVINAERFQGQWQFDASSVLKRATDSFPGRSYYDVEVHFPNSTFPPVRGELETAAKSGVICFNTDTPQPWIPT